MHLLGNRRLWVLLKNVMMECLRRGTPWVPVFPTSQAKARHGPSEPRPHQRDVPGHRCGGQPTRRRRLHGVVEGTTSAVTQLLTKFNTVSVKISAGGHTRSTIIWITCTLIIICT